jgi:hypothetical protein
MTEPKHDRWGRYILPNPTTGEERPWTRATTWANTIADTYGLTKWQMRMVAKGVATRKDLLALAASASIDEKGKLDGVAKDALEAAGGSAGRNLGTALHGFTEQIDRGEQPEVPHEWQRDVDAYSATLAEAGVFTVQEYIERVVVCEALGVAGTLDRIIRYEPEFFVADVKTGSDLSYAWGEIAVQLALYANADAMWDGAEYVPLPPLNREKALVIHLPIGRGKCDLYWVDIAAGWEAARLCGGVRDWRKRDNLAYPFGVDVLGRSPLQSVPREISAEAGSKHRPSSAPESLDREAPSRDSHPASAEISPAAETEGREMAPAEVRPPKTSVSGSALPAGDGEHDALTGRLDV